MTGCPGHARLAAAASGEDDRAAAHAEACARCGPVLDELIETATALAALSPPTLDSARRTQLADGVLVAADAGVGVSAGRTGPRRWPAIAVAVGLAAAGTIVVARGRHAAGTDPAAVATPVPARATDPVPAPAPATAAVRPPDPAADPAPRPAPARPGAGTGAAIAALGPADHSVDSDRATVRLRDGALAIDTRDRPAVAVQIGTTRIAIAGARVEVRAAHGSLASVRVFAGSVEIDAAGRRSEVVAGEVWEAVSAAEWFQRGWVAVRAGDHALAIAAFDRATDPAVAEDAAFWAAVAAERAGHADDAARRFERFVAAFPRSPRVDAARRRLAAPP